MAALVHMPEDGLYEGARVPIFLAGPCTGAPLWQDEVIEALSDLDVVIFNPRRKERFDSRNEQLYLGQVDWESYHLALCGQKGIIFFWIPTQAEDNPGRSYAQTTRFELAEWITNKRHHPDIQIVLGIEDSFSGKRYIVSRTKDLLEVHSTLDTAVAHLRRCLS